MIPRPVLLFTLLLLATALPACHLRVGGSTPVDQVIDELRTERDDLRKQVQNLTDENKLQAAQIDALAQRLAASQPGPGNNDPKNFPRFVALEFDRLSRLQKNVAIIYVHTLDQKGRFIPVYGRAVVSINVPGQAPVQLAARAYEPADFNKAYRSGFTGTHYSLEILITNPLPAALSEASVKLTVTDADTGVTVSTEQTLPINP